MLKVRRQTFNSGIARFYRAEDIADNGDSPLLELTPILRTAYEERTVGIKRFYEAMGFDQNIDKVIRIPFTHRLDSKLICVLRGKQYIVRQIQSPSGITPEVLDISVERKGGRPSYDISTD